jgi:hypothetical protein
MTIALNLQGTIDMAGAQTTVQRHLRTIPNYVPVLARHGPDCQTMPPELF